MRKSCEHGVAIWRPCNKCEVKQLRLENRQLITTIKQLQASLTEVKAQQAEESFTVGASWAMGKKLSTVARHDKEQAKKHADKIRNSLRMY